MAELVHKQHIDADVGYNAFGLQESDDADLPVPFPDDFDYAAFLSTHPGRLDIISGGHTHTAAVTVEVWDDPPPAQDRSGWDEQAEADFESASGEVAVWSMSLGRTGDLITLIQGASGARSGQLCGPG
ncbi:hypothetical protein [Streptomyces collinus]|uniref:hypothetical protein n=1 Tax=Streptomyces collinus TaxID=42684 RepID=UPI00343DBDC7